MAWELTAKNNAGMVVKMTLNENDTSLWDAIAMIIKNCTAIPTLSVDIAIKKI